MSSALKIFGLLRKHFTDVCIGNNHLVVFNLKLETTAFAFPNLVASQWIIACHQVGSLVFIPSSFTIGLDELFVMSLSIVLAVNHSVYSLCGSNFSKYARDGADASWKGCYGGVKLIFCI